MNDDIMIDEDDLNEVYSEVMALQDEMGIEKDLFAVLLAMVSKMLCETLEIEIDCQRKADA